jgi:hypothetical protein
VKKLHFWDKQTTLHELNFFDLGHASAPAASAFVRVRVVTGASMMAKLWSVPQPSLDPTTARTGRKRVEFTIYL